MRFGAEVLSVAGTLFTNLWRRFWRVVLFGVIIGAVTIFNDFYWPLGYFLLLIPGILFVALLQTLLGRGRGFTNFLTILMSSVLLVGLAYSARFAYTNLRNYDQQEVVTDDTPSVMYLKRNVNLRNGPSMNSVVLGVMYEFNRITYLYERDGNWVKVDYYGTPGWMYLDADFYSTSPVNPTCRLVAGKDGINMRAGPSMDDAVIRQVRSYETFTCLETSLDGKWTLVMDSSGNNGWIWRSYIQVLAS